MTVINKVTYFLVEFVFTVPVLMLCRHISVTAVIIAK